LGEKSAGLRDNDVLPPDFDGTACSQEQNTCKGRYRNGSGREERSMKVSKKGAGRVDSHVGQRVRMRRTLIGMSQERLGELLGLTFQQVQKYEKGMNRIGAGRLYEVAGILGVPIGFFYEEVDAGGRASGFAEDDEGPPLMDFLSSGEGIQLNLAFMRIKDGKVRRRILELVRSVAEERGGEA